MTETDKCTKCDSEISVEADRCPECGYEPSSGGVLNGILTFISLPWLGIGALFYVVAIWVLFTGGYTILNFIFAMLLITAFNTVPAFILYVSYRQSTMSPTDPEVFDSFTN